MILQHEMTRSGGVVGWLTGLGDMAILPGGDTVYTVTGQGGGVQAWDMQTLTLLDRYHFHPAEGLEAPRTLVSGVHDGAPALLVPGGFGTVVDGVTLQADGRLGEGFALAWLGDPAALTALLSIAVGGQAFVVAASRREDGLKVWRSEPDDRLVAVGQDLPLGLAPGAVPDLVEIGGGAFLIVSATEGTLLRLQLSAAGELALQSRLDLRDGLAIATPTRLEVIDLAGQAYAILGARGSSSLSVVALPPDGSMRVTDHVVDDRATRFAQLSVMETAEQDGRVYLVAGGGDDGLSLMTLLPGGRLLHLDTLADDAGMALSDPSALALHVRDTGLDIVVAGRVPDPEPGGSGLGLTRILANLGPAGVVRSGGPGAETLSGDAARDLIAGGPGDDVLSGGRGEDILVDGGGSDVLRGGPGRDVFVMAADGVADRIIDFELGLDRLDLSLLGRFYTVEALDILPRADGAEIRIGAERVILQSAGGDRLEPADFAIADLRGLWHLPVTPLAVKDQQIVGSALSDLLEGRGGDDTLYGGEGRDMLAGRDGDDWLLGGPVDDSFDPVSAQLYRLYQATLDRPPDPAGLYGWSDQLFSGGMSLHQVAGGFVQSREFQKVYGALDTGDFVTLLYRNVLDRAPDAEGLAKWSTLLDSGSLSREAVVLGFSESAEFRAKTAVEALSVSRASLTAMWSDDVFRLYQATLDRVPDPAGFASWTGLLAEGMALETVVSGFAESAEFRRIYGETSDAAFVRLLYDNVLGRSPDATGFASWTAQLAAGQMSRETVTLGFSQSLEFRLATQEPLTAWMRAQGFEDTLDGGTGANVLQGGPLADRFVFRSNAPGTHLVVDPEEWDVFMFEGFGYDSVADFAAHLTQRDGDVVFADQDVHVTWHGMALPDLTADMLLL